MKPPVVSLLLLGSCLFMPSIWAQFQLAQILAEHPQLSELQTLITNSTTLSALFLNQDATNFTLLAPNNAAIETWRSANGSQSSVQSSVEAVLLYHLLDGRYPTASISNLSITIPTALTNQTYANITGGQRVEASNTGVVEFQSDAKAITKVVTPDIVGNNSFIHIIDRVLQIPSIFGVAASESNLTYLIDLLNTGSYLENTAYAWDIATRRDSTYFVPNSALALSHIPPDGNQSTYNALLEYHCISQLAYSGDLVNGTELPTFNGGKVMIRVDRNGTIHANNAKVIATDYLVFNGVMHVIDDIMIPVDLPQTSTTSSTSTPTSKPSDTPVLEPTSSVSAAAKAGIGVAVGAVAILSLMGLFLISRKRRKHKKSLRAADGDKRTSMHEMNGNPFPEVRELETVESPVELQALPAHVRDETDSLNPSATESSLVESLPSSPVVQLPVYPRQQVDEDHEPKTMNQILEAGGLEPKTLVTPQSRPARPQEIPRRPP